MKLKSAHLMFMLLLVANVSCDQISKNMVRQKLHADITLIQNHVILTKVENSGAFLSTGSSLPQPFKFILLSLLPLGTLLFAMYYIFMRKEISHAARAAICFVVGGGLGNLYDRFVYGSVTDFLHIDFVIFRTGIFNLADVSIMIGIVYFLVTLRSSDHVNIPSSH